MRSEETNVIHRMIFIGLCTLLVYIPLPYGGVEEWAIFIFEAAVLLLYALHLAGRFMKSADLGGNNNGGFEEAGKITWPVKALLAFFLIIAGLQLVPLPLPVLKAFSPQTAGLYENLARDGILASSDSVRRTLSLSPALSSYELLKYLCYGIFAFLVYAHVRTRNEARFVVFVMMAAGLFESLYGLEEYFGGTYRIFGWKNTYYAGNAFGTFVNRNHFSAFLEMVLALSVGYLLARADFFSLKKGLSLREKIVWFGHERFQKTIIAGIAPVILGVGIVFSKSRSGVIIFLMSLLLMIIFISLGGGKKGIGGISGSPRLRRIVGVIFALVAGIAIWRGLAPVLERFSRELIETEQRPILYRYTLDMIRAFPFFGVGPGCYLYGYNMAERENTPNLTTHAHNDYLEVLAESGVVGGGALIAAALAALAALAAGWKRRHDFFVRGVMLGCIAGIAGMLIHSFTDFSLRMPANAAYFVALYALGLKVGTIRGRNGPGRPEGRKDAVIHAQFGNIGTALILAGAGLLLILVIVKNMGFLCLNTYKSERGKLAEKGRSLMSGFAELDSLLKKAVRWSGHPRFYEEQGRLYLEIAMAENQSGEAEKREAFLDLSRRAQLERIRRNPADAFAYYDLSRVYLFSNYPLLTYQNKARFYMRKALEFKPHDLSLNVNIISSYLVMWPCLDEEEKTFVFDTLKSVWRDEGEKFFPGLFGRWKGEGRDLEALKDILRLDADVWKISGRF